MHLPAGHTKWLGATPDARGEGTNFAFYTGKDATRVELCLFNKALGAHETAHFDLTAKEEVTGDNGQLLGYIWHGFAKDVGDGQLYGLRVHGPYDPDRRLFYNANKLLVDPCAKAVTSEIHQWEPRHFPSNFEDNGPIMPKARVVDWQKMHRDVAAEGLAEGAIYPHADTNIVELHVKGATILHPDIPEHERGTYSALSHPAFVSWMKGMEVSSVELMPVESFGTDSPLSDRGKKNYWGYMTMAPMASHTGYAATDRPEQELAKAIRTLKLARDPKNPEDKGIEVIMDIVPNHTLESGRGGPVVNLRGMDDMLYLHNDYTGTGNTRDFGHPINRRMLHEELLYWQGLGVSGFRIDLATIIGRTHGGDFNPESAMIKMLRDDYGREGGLHNVKFYGEPWDLGPNGYQIGRLAYHPPGEVGLFSNHIAEWDGKGRSTFQNAALNPDANVPRSELVKRIAGSDDLYVDPQHRVIKVASHDDMTLDNLVTFRGKRNHANGEDNRDGNHGLANWGVEGPTDDPVVNGNRMRAQRFAIALLAISQGVPMLSLGHERGKSQDGNSNAYCQDNGITHIPWGDQVRLEGRELMDFTRLAKQFRKKHFSLRRATHFKGKPDAESLLEFGGQKLKDVTWLDPLGGELAGGAMDWPGGFGMMLSGDPGNSAPGTEHFTRLVQRTKRDDPLLVLVNPTNEDITFKLPEVADVKWKTALNSCTPEATGTEVVGGQTITVGYRSMLAMEGQVQLEKGQQMAGAGRAHT